MKYEKTSVKWTVYTREAAFLKAARRIFERDPERFNSRWWKICQFLSTSVQKIKSTSLNSPENLPASTVLVRLIANHKTTRNESKLDESDDSWDVCVNKDPDNLEQWTGEGWGKVNQKNIYIFPEGKIAANNTLTVSTST